MQFVNAARNAKFPGPPQRAFTLDRWTKEHARLRGDDSDDELYRSAIWVHERFEAIRANLSFVKSERFSRELKLRVFIGTANQDAMTVVEKLAGIAAQRQPTASMASLQDIVGIKVQLPIGADFRVDEIIQSGADAVEFPLRELLNSKVDGPIDDVREIPWNQVATDIALGVAYLVYEDMWEECLWNDYAIREGKETVLSCLTPAELDRRIASELRDQNNSLTRSLTSDFGKYPLFVQQEFVKLRSIVAIEKHKKRTHYKLSKVPEINALTRELATHRHEAHDGYYDDLVKRPGSDLEITVEKILLCWQVIATGIELLWNKVHALPAPQRTVDLAPTFARRPLCVAVSESMNIPLGTATKLVDFLTFRGERGQEIWAQPLVQFGQDRLAPVFFAARRPNLRRNVDVWLAQIGITLAARGDPFEQHVRARCASYLEDSPIKHMSWVCDSSFAFGAASEQIDLIIRIGPLLLIGDSKCMLRPAEAGEWGVHRRKVSDAVLQVKTKCAAIETSRGAFLKQINSLGAARNSSPACSAAKWTASKPPFTRRVSWCGSPRRLLGLVSTRRTICVSWPPTNAST